MDPRQLISRLSQLKADGDAIMQQLIQAGIPPEQIMAAVEGGKKIWGEFVAEASFNPEWIVNVPPMAYVSVEYE